MKQQRHPAPRPLVPISCIPPGLEHCITFHIEAAMRIVQVRAEALAAAKFRLNVRELRILQAANSKPELSQGAVADCLGVNRNVMVLEIDRLEKRGYLTRVRKPDNRREQALVLTAKGRKVASTMRRMNAERQLLSPASRNMQAELLRWARAVLLSGDNVG